MDLSLFDKMKKQIKNVKKNLDSAERSIASVKGALGMTDEPPKRRKKVAAKVARKVTPKLKRKAKRKGK